MLHFLTSTAYISGMDLLLQIGFLAVGIYGLYTFRNMNRWSKLPANKILYPNGCPVDTCDDPEGFKKFMRPRLLIFSLLCLVTAGLSAAGSYLMQGSRPIVLATVVLGLGTMIFYMASVFRASKKFW